MVKEAYEYKSVNRKTVYVFVSEGQNKRVPKMVTFSPLGNKLWNLGFGDWQSDGSIDDSVISNNHDLIKVISTVAKIRYEFSEKYPLRTLQIKPVDEKRKRLYNHVFRRNYNIINANFEITGINSLNGIIKEQYSPEKTYNSFELKRRLNNEQR